MSDPAKHDRSRRTHAAEKDPVDLLAQAVFGDWNAALHRFFDTVDRKRRAADLSGADARDTLLVHYGEEIAAQWAEWYGDGDRDERDTAGPAGGGRVDVDGVEWFRTDGTDIWYRWSAGALVTSAHPVFPSAPKAPRMEPPSSEVGVPEVDAPEVWWDDFGDNPLPAVAGGAARRQGPGPVPWAVPAANHEQPGRGGPTMSDSVRQVSQDLKGVLPIGVTTFRTTSLEVWRNRMAGRLANAALRLATDDYRAFIGGSIRYGLLAATEATQADPPSPLTVACSACGAAEGRRCQPLSGEHPRTVGFHEARYAAAGWPSDDDA